jgi:bacteriocin-like protein
MRTHVAETSEIRPLTETELAAVEGGVIHLAALGLLFVAGMLIGIDMADRQYGHSCGWQTVLPPLGT